MSTNVDPRLKQCRRLPLARNAGKATACDKKPTGPVSSRSRSVPSGRRCGWFVIGEENLMHQENDPTPMWPEEDYEHAPPRVALASDMSQRGRTP